MKSILLSLLLSAFTLQLSLASPAKVPIPTDRPLNGSERVIANHPVPYRSHGSSELDEIGDTLHVGTTWYDIQHNGQVGRMIGYVPDEDQLYVVWMKGYNIQNASRHVVYRVIDAASSDGPVIEDGGLGQADAGVGRSGFATLALDISENEPFYTFHHIANDGTPYISKVALESPFVPGFFDLFACPDPLDTDNDVLFPRSTWGAGGFVHMINSDFPAGAVDPVRKYYMRWLYDPEIHMLSPATPNEEQVLMTDQAMNNSSDISTSSDGSQVAYTECMPRSLTIGEGESTQWNNDLWLWKSSDAGATWDEPIDVTQWIAPDATLLPDTLAANRDTLRCYMDGSVIFDADDNIHVVFSAPSFFYYEGIISRASRIFHWDQNSGLYSLVADGTQGYLGYPETFGLTADRPSIYSDPDTGILWVVYRRTSNLLDNPEGTDVADGFYACGDIYVTASPPGLNNGRLWTQPINITDTKWLSTQPMQPGDAQSEIDPSIALQCDGDYLYISYVVDTWPDRCTDTEATECPMVVQKVSKLDLLSMFSGWQQNFPMHVDSSGFWEDENGWAWNGFWGETTDPFVIPDNLDIGGDETLDHLVSNNPTITWDYLTNQGEPQAAYEIEVSTDPEFGTADLWATGWVESDAESVPYGGEPLPDGLTGYLRVRLQAGDLTSDWFSLSFHMNEAPSAPDLVSPEDEGDVTTGPILSVTAASDGDEDPLSYRFRLYDDPELSNLVRDSGTLQAHSWLVSPTPPNTTYYRWTVEVSDGFESTLVGPWGFMLNLVATPPDSFGLVSPEQDALLDTLAWTFTWEASHDSDPGDSLIYWLQLSLDESFLDTSTTFYRRADGDTSYPVPVLLDDTDYWWRVLALDTNTGGTLSDETWHFHTAWPQPPTHFALLEPEDGISLGEEQGYSAAFTWESSRDPDPGESVAFDLVAHVTADGLDTLLRVDALDEPGFNLNIPEMLGLEQHPQPLQVEWHVEAISDPDTVLSSETWHVRIEATDAVPEEGTALPREYSIESLYPNPFNPVVTVVVGLPEAAPVLVEVYNLLGSRVASLGGATLPAGHHKFVFDGSRHSSGVYFVRASVPGKLEQVRKVVLMK